jgi:hypothetical protein
MNLYDVLYYYSLIYSGIKINTVKRNLQTTKFLLSCHDAAETREKQRPEEGYRIGTLSYPGADPIP